MPLVSIIVPVYKVEKYLERCVQSILRQTLSDIEVILVDDGSPDNCGQMCDELANKDNRIVVVHKKNGGLSSARNAGLQVANGEYIGFVDSDDAVTPLMYEKLYDIGVKHHCDVVMCDYRRILLDGTDYVKSLQIPAGLYSKEKIKTIIFPSLIMGSNLDYGPLLSVWHCLYSKQFLKSNNLLFDEEVRWSEDNIFSAFVGYYANSFYYLKGEALYDYYQNEGTITTGYRPGCWNVYCTMNHHLKYFFAERDNYYFDYQLKLHQLYYACNSISQIKNAPISNEEKKLNLKTILNSQELADAFQHFKYPKEWNWKLKLQIFFIQAKCSWIILHT